MRVRLNIGLDFDGNHTFEWQPSNDPRAIDIPRSTLNRWAAEREAFTVAYLRWRRVTEEIEDALYRADSEQVVATVSAKTDPERVVTTVNAKPDSEQVAVATVSAKPRAR